MFKKEVYFRAFSIYNYLMTKLRTKLGNENIGSLLILRYTSDTVYTIDASKMTAAWLRDGHVR